MTIDDKRDEREDMLAAETRPGAAPQSLSLGEYSCVHLRPEGGKCGCPLPPPDPEWICPSCKHIGIYHQPD